jgi:hypothetical protein
LLDAIYSGKINDAHGCFAQHQSENRNDLLTFLWFPGRTPPPRVASRSFALASSSAKPGAATALASAPALNRYIMPERRSFWQRNQNALDFLSRLLPRSPAPIALPP